jgi:hypothetical protein
MRWCVPPIWDGGEVWILGGGASLTTQFGIPDDVVKAVRDKEAPLSAYSPYMEAIHNKHVIAVNVAFMIGEWIDMMFFGDIGIYTGNKHILAKWPGIRITCHDGVRDISWIKYLRRDGKHPKGISPDPNCISWNANSGGSAISVAANAGAKRIILVGFDMTNIGGERHWHNQYEGVRDISWIKYLRRDGKHPKGISPDPNKVNGQEQQPPPPPKKRGRFQPPVPFSFTKHLLGFPVIAKDAKARGIEIINASPESVIDVFPKCNVKDLL